MTKCISAVSMAIFLLAGCDRTGEPAPTDDDASPATSAVDPPASIIRTDVAPSTPEPRPLEPLSFVIEFPDGGAALAASEVEKLESLIESIQVQQGGPVELGAHSDSAGTDSANLRASRKRGEAVRDWLVEKGVAKDRIALVSFGEQNPVRPNALPNGEPDEAGRAANRRVEIRVAVTPAPAETRAPTLAEEIVERTEGQKMPTKKTDNSD